MTGFVSNFFTITVKSFWHMGSPRREIEQKRFRHSSPGFPSFSIFPDCYQNIAPYRNTAYRSGFRFVWTSISIRNLFGLWQCSLQLYLEYPLEQFSCECVDLIPSSIPVPRAVTHTHTLFQGMSMANAAEVQSLKVRPLRSSDIQSPFGTCNS